MMPPGGTPPEGRPERLPEHRPDREHERQQLGAPTDAGAPSAALAHRLEWNDRLQDWLDAQADAAEAAAVQAHLEHCGDCHAYLRQFQKIDAGLRDALPAAALDASFDARLYARIDAGEVIGAYGRPEARRRAEEELQRNLRTLSSSWRRALLLVVPGIVAGLAIAFALSAWIDAAGWSGALMAEGAKALGEGASHSLQVALTALFGAGIGLGLARWLSSLAD